MKDVCEKNEGAEPFDIVCYHAVSKGANCTDGFAAAFAAWFFNPRIKAIPVVHGDSLPLDELRGKRVVFVDFCPPPDALTEVLKVAKHTLVLDHHKTAKDAMNGYVAPEKATYTVLFSLEDSGATLTWRYFNSVAERRRVGIPVLLEYVADADLGLYRLPYSREIRASLTTLKWDFEDWSASMYDIDYHFDSIIRMGTAILSAEKAVVERIATTAEVYDDPDLGGPFAIVNSPAFQSEVGEHLAKKHGRALIWWVDGPAKLIRLSFRSDGNPKNEVSGIAKAYGGGGHPQASGATLPLSHLDKWQGSADMANGLGLRSRVRAVREAVQQKL